MHPKVRRYATTPERGQTVVLVAVFMMSLMGMATFAIDMGSWYQSKRAVQAAADAAALAGASRLPVSSSAATTAASAEYQKNGLGSDSVSYQVTTNQHSSDSLTVTATRVVPTWFAKLFGYNSTTITATSRATVQSFQQVVPNQNVMPWGVL